jgi:hypothetical protein
LPIRPCPKKTLQMKLLVAVWLLRNQFLRVSMSLEHVDAGSFFSECLLRNSSVVAALAPMAGLHWTPAPGRPGYPCLSLLQQDPLRGPGAMAWEGSHLRFCVLSNLSLDNRPPNGPNVGGEGWSRHGWVRIQPSENTADWNAS